MPWFAQTIRYEKGLPFRLFAHWSHHTQIGVSSVCLFGGKTPEYPLRISKTEAHLLSHKTPASYYECFRNKKKILQFFWELSEKKPWRLTVSITRSRTHDFSSELEGILKALEGAARPREFPFPPNREWRSTGNLDLRDRGWISMVRQMIKEMWCILRIYTELSLMYV